MTVSVVSSELLIVSLPSFVWWYIIICLSVLWKDCFAMFKVTVKVQNLIMIMHYHEPECCIAKQLFGCHGQGHNEGSYNKTNMTISTTCLELQILLQPNWDHKLECLVERLLCSRSWSQWWFKTSLNVCQSYVFCTTNISASELAVWIYCY